MINFSFINKKPTVVWMRCYLTLYNLCRLRPNPQIFILSGAMKVVPLLLALAFFVSATQATTNPLDILKDYFSIDRPFTGSSQGTKFACKLPKGKTVKTFQFRYWNTFEFSCQNLRARPSTAKICLLGKNLFSCIRNLFNRIRMKICSEICSIL